MILFYCTKCSEPVDAEDAYFADRENDICQQCNEKWISEQARYWRPLYEGEKSAGLLEPDPYQTDFGRLPR